MFHVEHFSTWNICQKLILCFIGKERSLCYNEIRYKKECVLILMMQ